MTDKIRTTEKVDQMIDQLSPDIQEITNALRKVIFDASPKLIEEFKWSMPSYSYKGLVCYLQPAKKHVNLGFYKGNEIESDLLKGTGKAMRHIRVTKLEDIQEDIFTSLVKKAITLNGPKE